jgi:ABC-2 type transport system ATP-binding protein
MTKAMISAHGLSRTYGMVRALDSVDLRVDEGRLLGLLGHNGAGKTTLVNILTTLVPPTSGSATVAGFDVTTRGDEVRRRIGLTGQYAAVDENLTGRQNLVLIARLLGASRPAARSRAEELLATFRLEDAADRPCRTYSGGMRRRLDLAASLVGAPAVLFLDEPTTGLDPSSRLALWDIVRDLTDRGTAVLLTTQYLEEADRLADSIAVMSHGRVVAEGTAAELKAQVGGMSVHVVLAGEGDRLRAEEVLAATGFRPARSDEGASLAIPVTSTSDLVPVVRTLDDAGLAVQEIGVAEPTLDDVYLAISGDSQVARV